MQIHMPHVEKYGTFAFTWIYGNSRIEMSVLYNRVFYLKAELSKAAAE